MLTEYKSFILTLLSPLKRMTRSSTTLRKQTKLVRYTALKERVLKHEQKEDSPKFNDPPER